MGMAWSQRQVARELTRLSGNRDFVSRHYIIIVTRAGVFVIRHVLGSRV